MHTQPINKVDIVARQLRLFEKFHSVPDYGTLISHFNLPLVILRDVFWPNEDSLALLEACQIDAGDTVLDVGTGSGIIAVSCALSGAGSVTALLESRGII